MKIAIILLVAAFIAVTVVDGLKTEGKAKTLGSDHKLAQVLQALTKSMQTLTEEVEVIGNRQNVQQQHHHQHYPQGGGAKMADHQEQRFKAGASDKCTGEKKQPDHGKCCDESTGAIKEGVEKKNGATQRWYCSNEVAGAVAAPTSSDSADVSDTQQGEQVEPGSQPEKETDADTVPNKKDGPEDVSETQQGEVKEGGDTTPTPPSDPAAPAPVLEARVSGNCKRMETTLGGTCSKDAECFSDKSNPCTGNCVCDKERLNECQCLSDAGCTTKESVADQANDGYCLDKDGSFCTEGGDANAVCSQCTGLCKCDLMDGIKCGSSNTFLDDNDYEHERKEFEPMALKDQLSTVAALGAEVGDFADRIDLEASAELPNNGIDWLGVGYNILKGNPAGDPKSQLDPGFRQPVVDLQISGGGKLTRDLKSASPREGYSWPVTSCAMSSSTEKIASASDYVDDLQVDASVSGEVSGFIASGSFEASVGMKTFTKEIVDTNSEVYKLTSYCYDRFFGLFRGDLRGTTAFARRAAKLPRVTSPMCDLAMFDDPMLLCVTISVGMMYLTAIMDKDDSVMLQLEAEEDVMQREVDATERFVKAWTYQRNAANEVNATGQEGQAELDQASRKLETEGLAGTPELWWVWDERSSTIESLSVKKYCKDNIMAKRPAYLQCGAAQGSAMMGLLPNRCHVKSNNGHEPEVFGTSKIMSGSGETKQMLIYDEENSTVTTGPDSEIYTFELNKMGGFIRKSWFDLFEDHGTHFIDTLYTGGRMETEVTFSEEARSSSSQNSLDIAGAVSAEYGPVSGSISGSSSENTEKTNQDALSGGSTKVTVYGGSPPATTADAKAAFQVWAETVKLYPMPIKYTMRGLDQATPLIKTQDYELMLWKYVANVRQGVQTEYDAWKMESPGKVGSTLMPGGKLAAQEVDGEIRPILASSDGNIKLYLSMTGLLEIKIIGSGKAVLWSNEIGIKDCGESLVVPYLEYETNGDMSVVCNMKRVWHSGTGSLKGDVVYIPCDMPCYSSSWPCKDLGWLPGKVVLQNNGELQVIGSNEERQWDSGSSNRAALDSQNWDKGGWVPKPSDYDGDGKSYCLIISARETYDDWPINHHCNGGSWCADVWKGFVPHDRGDGW